MSVRCLCVSVLFCVVCVCRFCSFQSPHNPSYLFGSKSLKLVSRPLQLRARCSAALTRAGDSDLRHRGHLQCDTVSKTCYSLHPVTTLTQRLEGRMCAALRSGGKVPPSSTDCETTHTPGDQLYHTHNPGRQPPRLRRAGGRPFDI